MRESTTDMASLRVNAIAYKIPYALRKPPNCNRRCVTGRLLLRRDVVDWSPVEKVSFRSSDIYPSAVTYLNSKICGSGS